MAALPPIRRLLIEDFPTQKSWISPLLLILNTFFESVVSAFNKNLTLVDNTTSDIKTVTLSGTLPVSVSWTKPAKPAAVLVGNVSLTSGADVTLSAALGITWSMSDDGKSLQVQTVFGITPSTTNKYVLTLICIQG